MPLYEFRCLDCGQVSEYLATSGKDRPEKCASCGGAKLEKVFSSFSTGSAGKSSPGPCSGSCPTGTCPYA